MTMSTSPLAPPSGADLFRCLVVAYGVALALLCPRSAFSQNTPRRQSAPEPLTTLYDSWLKNPSISPNARFFLADRFDRDAVAYDARSKRWTPLGSAIGEQPRWSPDGRFVASVRQESLRSPWQLWLTPIDTATGLPTGIARRISTRPARSPNWSPDGRRIVFSSDDNGTFRVVIIPFNGGDEDVVYTASGHGGQTAWSRDGKTVVASLGEEGDRFVRIDLATKKAVFSAPENARALAPLGFSADGQQLAGWRRSRGELAIRRPTDGAVLSTFSIPPYVFPAAWMPQGHALLAVQNVIPQHVELVDTRTGRIRALTPVDTALIQAMSVSPDSKTLAYVRGGQVVFQAVGSGAARTIGGLVARDIYRTEWSPDGRRLIACSGEQLAVIDVATAKARILSKGDGKPAVSGADCRWAKKGSVLHWARTIAGVREREHQVREVTLNGEARLLTRVIAERYPHLLDDTLLTYPTGDALLARHLVTGKDITLDRGRAANVFVEWASDGKRMLTVKEQADRTFPLILNIADGTSTKIPYTLPGELASVRFHPDGRHLVGWACNTCAMPNWVEKWDIVMIPLNGEPARILTASQSDYRDHGEPVIAPDGSFIAFSGEKQYTSRIVSLPIPRR